MECKKCGKEITKVVIYVFNYDGTDSHTTVPIQKVPEHDTYEFYTWQNWCGYELTEEEQKEQIECPECGRYPFDETAEVQICEPVVVSVIGD